MAVERRYFRYDVSLAMHLEPVDRFGKQLNAERRQLVSELEEEQLKDLNAQLDEWLEKVFDASSSALHVFYTLNHRMNFFWWLLDQLIETNDPRNSNDFKFRLKEDSKFKPPKNGKNSSVAPLIIALYNTIDAHLSELISVVDSSLEGKIFIYANPDFELFDDKKFVTNLDVLASSGVLPAKVLRLMIDKLNILETVLERIKDAFCQMSKPESWDLYDVNLSAGGFSFESDQKYELFNYMDIFMNVDDEVLICRGKIISVNESHREDRPFRVGVEFDLLTHEQQHKITIFEQRKELQDAMSKVTID
jgi:hypothetical protein